MAIIKFSNLVNDIRGSTGGNTFARNRSGAYVRNRTMPLNPQSQAQSAQRAAFGSLTQAWRNLTESQRAAWNSIADEYPYLNKLGETRTYSGEQLYIVLNRNLQAAGEDTIDNPLSPAGVPAPIITDLEVIDDDTINVTGSVSGETTDAVVVVQATAPVSAGKSTVPRSAFRNITTTDVSSLEGGLDVSSEYEAKFGSLTDAAGSKVFFRVYGVNSVTGQASAAERAGEVVAEAV